MATSIGKLALMISGDSTDLDAGFAKAVKDTEKFRDKVEATANKISLSDRVAGGLKDFAGKVKTGLDVAKTGLDLVRGQFDTTGQALAMVGSIAETIPGPWGAAIGSVLGVAGKVIDWLEGPLVRAQQAARKGFLEMATGARTVQGTVSSIRLEVLQEGLERMTRLAQGRGRLNEFGENVLGGLYEQAQGREIERIRGQAQARLDMFHLLRNDPRLRGVRAQIATEQATEGLQTMAREPRLMLAQRTITRSLRGEQGFDQARVQTALMTVALDRFASQGIQPTAEQFARLQQQARQTMTTLRTQYAALQVDQMTTALQTEVATLNLDADAQQRRVLRMAGATAAQIDQVRALQELRNVGTFAREVNQQNEAWSRQAATLGMTSREAQLFNLELQRRDVLTRLDRANTDNLTAAQRQQLRTALERMDADLANMRVQDRVMDANERRLALMQEQAGAGAQVDFLNRQTAALRGQASFMADMTREQSEINLLRLRGAEAWRIEQAQANLGQLEFIRLQQQMAQAALQMTQQNLSPLEQYQNGLRRAEDLFARGQIDFTTYAREVERVSAGLESATQNQNLPPALLAGSREALAAISRNQRRAEGETAVERVRAVLAQIRQQDAERNRQLETVARNTAPGRIQLVLRPAQLGGG